MMVVNIGDKPVKIAFLLFYKILSWNKQMLFFGPILTLQSPFRIVMDSILRK